MKPQDEHLPFLDYFRGVAILSVFFYHSFSATFGPAAFQWNGLFHGCPVSGSLLVCSPGMLGWIGVPIFFTISGFCIHLSHQRSRSKSYRVFFLRRFFRIYPPYFLALLFFALLYPGTRLGFGLGSRQFALLQTSLEDFISHLFLLHNLFARFDRTTNGSFWSIAVEVQLYALYPLLLWLAGRLGWTRTLWLTALVELGLRACQGFATFYAPSYELPQLVRGTPPYFWFEWTMGAALAEAWLTGKELPFRSSWGCLWPVLLVGFYFYRPLVPFCYTLAALSSIYLMSWCLGRSTHAAPLTVWFKYPLEHLRWAGIVSYSAYLLHQPLVNTIPRMVAFVFRHHPIPDLLMIACCFSAWLPIFGLSYLVYHYIEQPSIALGKWMVNRTRRPNYPLPSTD